MARRRRQFSIIEAIPRARRALRWYGWVGVALLIVPAVMLAVLAAVDLAGAGLPQLGWALAVCGIVVLLAAGIAAVLTLSGLRQMTELAQLLCERGNGPVLVKDTEHRYRFVNEAAAALVGRHPTDILGRRDGELDPGATALAYEENDRVCLDRDLPTLFRESQQAVDGEHTFLVAKYPLHNTRGRITGLVGVARDISDELQLQHVARQRNDETRIWFDLNPLPAITFAAADGRILGANPAALRCYGYPLPRLTTMYLPELFATNEAARLQAYLQREGRVITAGSVGWQQVRADGEVFSTLVDMGSLPHADVPSHVMLVRDISAEKAAHQSLDEAHARYEDLVESGLAMVWMHDLDGRLLRVNGALADALGYERERMAGRLLAEFVADETRQEWTDYLDRTRSLKRDAGLLHVVTSNGERRVWQYQFVCYPDARPRAYVLGAAQDVTLRHRYESRMRDQNQRDALTGCRTRRYLEVLALQATLDQVWGCVVIDIDYFRQLNASEGRARGDAVLGELAHVLTLHAHEGDEVIRLDGDQFAIVAPQATTAAMRDRVRQLAEVSRDGMPAVFSLGWAVREGGESLAATLRRADKMLLHDRLHERS